jgi:hypothetical protein
LGTEARVRFAARTEVRFCVATYSETEKETCASSCGIRSCTPFLCFSLL